MPRHLDDQKVRTAAFDWLKAQLDVRGDVLARDLLLEGFVLDGERVPLMSRQGIFKPRVLAEIPLSITTTPKGPYQDTAGKDGLILYSYRGTNPDHPENRGLQKAMVDRVPLVYFYGLVPSKYMAIWPVYIVGDDPGSLMFKVAVDDVSQLGKRETMRADAGAAEDEDTGRRVYVTSVVRQRLHQRSFRERVLTAYREQCALCRLRHRELLDAAHIIPDGEPDGDPIVPNGLALCKLHHAAFDKFFLGIRPDYVIEIRKDVLEEDDGPMLTHGLQGLHGLEIVRPRSMKLAPRVDLLERRYERFRSAK